MSKFVATDLDFNQNEIQNAVEQNLATAPSNPKEGQINGLMPLIKAKPICLQMV